MMVSEEQFGSYSAEYTAQKCGAGIVTCAFDCRLLLIGELVCAEVPGLIALCRAKALIILGSPVEDRRSAFGQLAGAIKILMGKRIEIVHFGLVLRADCMNLFIHA